MTAMLLGAECVTVMYALPADISLWTFDGGFSTLSAGLTAAALAEARGAT